MLKSEVAPAVDTAMPEGKLKVRNAVGAAHLIANQGAKGIAVFEAWVALKEAFEQPSFANLPSEIEAVRSSSTARLFGTCAKWPTPNSV